MSAVLAPVLAGLAAAAVVVAVVDAFGSAAVDLKVTATDDGAAAAG